MYNESYLVSVLIPVFNHGHYLDECLDSVANQDHKNIELLLCDDGSTDNSLVIIDRWIVAHPEINVKLFVHEKNEGICKTLNNLLEQASGDYITICASDDVLLADGITIRLNTLLYEPSLDIVIGDAIVINELSTEEERSAMRSLYNANISALMYKPETELVFNWSVVGPTMLAKRVLYEKVGGYDNSLLIEDRDFYLRCLAINTLKFIDRPVAKYRVHSSNASKKTLSSRFFIWGQIAKSNVKNANLFSGLERFFLKSHHVDLMMLSLGKSNVLIALLFVFRWCRRLLFNFFHKISQRFKR